MKNKYSKPQVKFEDFSLSNSVAADCSIKVDTQSSGVCGLDMQGIVIFIDGYTGCDVPILSGIYETICYHVPYETNNLFNS